MTLRLNGSTSGYTEIDAPAVAGSNTLVLPTGNGSSGQVLSTNGSGVLSWAGAGKILQVVQTVKTDTFSRTSSGSDYGEITGLSVSITPTSTSNKVLIIARVSASSGIAGNRMGIRLTAAGSVITAYQGSGTGAGSRTSAASSAELDGINAQVELTATHLHSPSTTSSITYAVQGSAEGSQTFFCNRSGNDSDAIAVYRTCSSIIVMEVAA
jgi:hypothetical protein